MYLLEQRVLNLFLFYNISQISFPICLASVRVLNYVNLPRGSSFHLGAVCFLESYEVRECCQMPTNPCAQWDLIDWLLVESITDRGRAQQCPCHAPHLQTSPCSLVCPCTNEFHKFLFSFSPFWTLSQVLHPGVEELTLLSLPIYLKIPPLISQAEGTYRYYWDYWITPSRPFT